MNVLTDISGLLLVVLAVLAFGSTFYSIWSLMNAARLRGVRLTWNGGRLWGLPLLPTIFLLGVVIAGSFVHQSSYGYTYPVTAFFVWIGVNWFVGSFLASRKYITDHGIVKNVNDPSQTVAWYQIVDYLENSPADKNPYMFLYQEYRPGEVGLNDCIRLELNVPEERRPEFEKIVSYKLGKTIDTEMLPLKDIRVTK